MLLFIKALITVISRLEPAVVEWVVEIKTHTRHMRYLLLFPVSRGVLHVVRIFFLRPHKPTQVRSLKALSGSGRCDVWSYRRNKKVHIFDQPIAVLDLYDQSNVSIHIQMPLTSRRENLTVLLPTFYSNKI